MVGEIAGAICWRDPLGSIMIDDDATFESGDLSYWDAGMKIARILREAVPETSTEKAEELGFEILSVHSSAQTVLDIEENYHNARRREKDRISKLKKSSAAIKKTSEKLLSKGAFLHDELAATFVDCLSGAAEAIDKEISLADLKPGMPFEYLADVEKGRGRPKAFEGNKVTEKVYEVLKEITGKEPSQTTDPIDSTRSGLFTETLEKILKTLGSKAKSGSQIGQFRSKKNKSPGT